MECILIAYIFGAIMLTILSINLIKLKIVRLTTKQKHQVFWDGAVSYSQHKVKQKERGR